MCHRPPVRHGDSLLLAVVRVGFEGLAQQEVEPIVHAEGVDAVFQVDHGVNGVVAVLEGPQLLGEQSARRLPLVLSPLFPLATCAGPVAAVPAMLALNGHLPALAQLHGVPCPVAIRHEGIILAVAVVVAAQPTHFAREHSRELHHHAVIPVVEDLHAEVGFNQHGHALLLQLESPMDEGDGEVGAVVVHLEEKKPNQSKPNNPM